MNYYKKIKNEILNIEAYKKVKDYSKNKREIEDSTIDINSYDTIYVGFPIWWGIAPNVVKTFMDKIDLSNKIIITFCTSGGSSLSPATIDLQETYPNANIENGRVL